MRGFRELRNAVIRMSQCVASSDVPEFREIPIRQVSVLGFDQRHPVSLRGCPARAGGDAVEGVLDDSRVGSQV